MNNLIHPGEVSYQDLEKRDIRKYPYEVYHPEGFDLTGMRPPKFKTWPEARTQAKEWNKDVPGHKARKRKLTA